MSNKNSINFKNNKLDNYLRPQWSWKSFVFIIFTILVLILVSIDLNINFVNLFTNSFNYLPDILSRMLPPDFSDFSLLVFAMIETIEIALIGTFIAIILSIPLALCSARNISPNIFIFYIARTITVFLEQYLSL